MGERSSISTEDKIAVIKRELALRSVIYPKQVKSGSMPQEKADFEIKVMQEILADYRNINGSGKLA